jgi:hypothetical protein
MALSARAQAFQGQEVIVRKDLGIIVMTPEFQVVRRTGFGERGIIESVSDAGFSGLLFSVRLTTGERVNAYERDIKLVNV